MLQKKKKKPAPSFPLWLHLAGPAPLALSPRLSTLSGRWSGSPVSPPAAPHPRPRTSFRTSPALRRATQRHLSAGRTPRGAARSARRPAEESSRRALRPPRGGGSWGGKSLRREETSANQCCETPPSDLMSASYLGNRSCSFGGAAALLSPTKHR